MPALLRGQLPVSVFAHIQGLELSVVDCGVAEAVAPHNRLLARKIAHGTRSARATSAMSLDQAHAEWSDEVALTVVMAARGYPGNYRKGSVIEALPADSDDTKIFHAGTALKDGALIATGGRVLNVTALGKTVSEAQAAAYKAVSGVTWEDGFCRRDIGWRALKG